MIPTIETIVEGVKDGSIDPSQAVAWLHVHAESAARDLRDDFAMSALQGLLPSVEMYSKELVRQGKPDVSLTQFMSVMAYAYADAMLAARQA